MPQPTKVWMVPLGHTPMVEIAGVLFLDDEGLLFTPLTEETPATRLRLLAIAKITRLRGSPVLMVTHVDGAGVRGRTAFYFTQPPALSNIVKSMTPEPAPSADLRSLPRPGPFGIGGPRPSKRKAVRTNATYLTMEGTNRRRELQGWVDEVRARLPKG